MSKNAAIPVKSCAPSWTPPTTGTSRQLDGDACRGDLAAAAKSDACGGTELSQPGLVVQRGAEPRPARQEEPQAAQHVRRAQHQHHKLGGRDVADVDVHHKLVPPEVAVQTPDPAMRMQPLCGVSPQEEPVPLLKVYAETCPEESTLHVFCCCMVLAWARAIAAAASRREGGGASTAAQEVCRALLRESAAEQAWLLCAVLTWARATAAAAARPTAASAPGWAARPAGTRRPPRAGGALHTPPARPARARGRPALRAPAASARPACRGRRAGLILYSLRV